MNRALVIYAAVLACALSTSCSFDTPVTAGLRPFKAVRMNAHAVNLPIGETLPLALTAIDQSGATLSNVPAPMFSSSDTTVATVDANGVVTAIGLGLTLIVGTVSSDNLAYSDTTELSVSAQPITLGSFAITPDTTFAATGDQLRIQATATDAAGDPLTVCSFAEGVTQDCIAAAFHSEDRTKLGSQYFNQFGVQSVGTAQVIAEIGSNGVTKVDTATVIITYPIAAEIDMSFEPGSGPFFFPGAVILQAGGTVTWCNFSGLSFDVTFENPDAVTGGNIPASTSDCSDRTFPTAGDYRFTSTTNGVSGEVLVK